MAAILERFIMQLQMDFTPAQKELNACKRCFERMLSAKNYEEYEEAWCDFLNRLEKVFEKLQRACYPHKEKFNSLLSKENALRNSDPLLQYLKQARNADTHSIQDVAKRVPGSFQLGFDVQKAGESVHIETLVMRGTDIREYRGSHPLIVTFTSETVEVKEVINRNVHYPPPLSHLSQPLITRHPTELARLGIDFYEVLFDKVTNFFSQ